MSPSPVIETLLAAGTNPAASLRAEASGDAIPWSHQEGLLSREGCLLAIEGFGDVDMNACEKKDTP
jgi:hypothetical protein